MQTIETINNLLNGLVWGVPMIALISGAGIFLTYKLRFLQITKLFIWWKGTFSQLVKRSEIKDDRNITPFQAVSTAMASTVGTGNIVGVATAITLGGPGAIFWMWVSALFGMATKYCEIVLALKFRMVDENGVYHGGPMYYIQNGLGIKWLAAAFSLFGALAAFGIGNMTQANAVSSSLEQMFSIPPLYTGIALSIICAVVIIGGIKRIASVTEKIVPFMAVFYIICVIVILFMNADRIPGAFGAIFEGAFSMQTIGGGIMGYALIRAMRFGIARGVFSNEAGLGSAPIAHAASRTKEPVEQGFWGIFEVFVDTIVICTLTGLVILTSGLLDGNISGAPLVLAAFNQSLGELGGIFFSIAVLFFAGATMLGWSYYGQQCLGYLTNNDKIAGLCYKLLFSMLIITGATGGLTLIWSVSDTLNGLMAIPNLIALLLLHKVVIDLTKRYFAQR